MSFWLAIVYRKALFDVLFVCFFAKIYMLWPTLERKKGDSHTPYFDKKLAILRHARLCPAVPGCARLCPVVRSHDPPFQP